MSLERANGFSREISEEAAEWLVEFRTEAVGPAGRREFDAWVRSSPEHLRAFIEMALLWHESGAVDSKHQLDVAALIERIGHDRNVVDLSSSLAPRESARPPAAGRDPPARPAHEDSRPVRWSSRRSAARLAIAASLLLAIVGGGLILGQALLSRSIYRTGVGEQRSVRLPDGSTVILDSRSSLRVDFTASTREVELLQGQALFSVAHNPQRPFLVRAGQALIRDIGTQFDIERRQEDIIVTVVHGRVSVSAPGVATRTNAVARLRKGLPGKSSHELGAKERRDNEPIFVSAGEQLDVLANSFSPELLARVSVGSVVAWTRGRIVLESATLREAAEEFNRYSSRKMVVDDRGHPPLRVSGVFATDPDILIQFLRGRSDTTIIQTHSEIDIIRNPKR